MIKYICILCHRFYNFEELNEIHSGKDMVTYWCDGCLENHNEKILEKDLNTSEVKE